MLLDDANFRADIGLQLRIYSCVHAAILLARNCSPYLFGDPSSREVIRERVAQAVEIRRFGGRDLPRAS